MPPSIRLTKGKRRRVVDRRFAAIDKRRQELGLTRTSLVRDAGIARATWDRHAKGQTKNIRQSTLDLLQDAINQVPRPPPPDELNALHRATMQLFARELGADPEQVLATDFTKQTSVNPTWLLAARIRRLAMSVLAVERGIGKSRIARAIGCTKQNVGQAVSQISDLREEDPAIESAIEHVAQLLGGERL